SCFFFHVPPPPQFSTLSLHDALPISLGCVRLERCHDADGRAGCPLLFTAQAVLAKLTLALLIFTRFASSKSPCIVACGLHTLRRSEEHTSELQSRVDLVCRLLLEKKK